jgi:hypothetical protein
MKRGAALLWLLAAASAVGRALGAASDLSVSGVCHVVRALDRDAAGRGTIDHRPTARTGVHQATPLHAWLRRSLSRSPAA